MKKKLKALLLCAGFGTRLRPLTNKRPKCLVEIGGQVLLGRWLRELERIGVQEVLINTHHLADQVNSFVNKWKSNSLKIYTIYEKNLLGTAGTLISNKKFFTDSTCLFLHADNFTKYDMNLLLKAHKNRSKECDLTMLTFKSSQPEDCGIVEVDNNAIVIGFYEKVKNPPTKIANGAIFVFENQFINKLTDLSPTPLDFSKDVIPKFIGKVQTCYTSSEFIDIGTPKNLELANSISSK